MNFVDVGINEANGAVVAETQGLRLAVSPAKVGALRAYKGQQIALGVRPEDVHVASGADPANHTFDAIVEVVEPLGSEILLDVRVGRSTIVARVDPSVRVKIHETVRLAVTADRLHFFDAKTEQSV
jgi:multiple sugar transport system ATP-binding protein